MVKCSLFGTSIRNGQKKKGSKPASLTREETIASAFFCKCKRPVTVKSTTVQTPLEPADMDNQKKLENDDNNFSYNLAPLL